MVPLYTREPPSARNLARRPIVQLQRPSPQPALTCDRREPLLSRISRTPLHTCALSSRDFLGHRSPAILTAPAAPNRLRSMSPKTGQMTFRQQEPVVPGMLHQPVLSLYQPLLETRDRPARDPRRQHQPAPEVAQVVGEDELSPCNPTPTIPAPRPRRVSQLFPAGRDGGRWGDPSVRGRVEFRRGRLQACDGGLGHDAV